MAKHYIVIPQGKAKDEEIESIVPLLFRWGYTVRKATVVKDGKKCKAIEYENQEDKQ